MEKIEKKEIRQKSSNFFKDSLIISIILLFVLFSFFYLKLYEGPFWQLFFGYIIIAGLAVMFVYTLTNMIKILLDRTKCDYQELEGYVSAAAYELRHDVAIILKQKTYIGVRFFESAKPKTTYKISFTPEFKLKKHIKIRIVYMKRSRIVLAIELLEDWNQHDLNMLKDDFESEREEEQRN